MLVGNPLVCVREMPNRHGQNGYMERFTFTDTDADMDADTDTRTFGHPLSMTDDPKIFTDTVTDTDTDTRTCRHSFTVERFKRREVEVMTEIGCASSVQSQSD